MPSRRNVRFNPEAEDDLVDIFQYTLGKWGEVQADKYMNDILEATDTIARFERIGKERFELELGMRGFQSERHIIFYTFDQTDIIVWRILHTRHALTRDDFS